MTTTEELIRTNGDVSGREAELEAQLRRERLVRENLAQRVGMLINENLELLVRLQELEQRQREGAPS